MVGLVTGLDIVFWAWRLQKTSGQGIYGATHHLLLLPCLWIGGGGVPGWTGSVLLQVLHLRAFLASYFLTAVAMTALPGIAVLVVFIFKLAVESGMVKTKSRGACARPRARKPKKPGAADD